MLCSHIFTMPPLKHQHNTSFPYYGLTQCTISTPTHLLLHLVHHFLTGSPGKIEGFTPFLSEPDEDLLEIAEKMAMPKVVAHPFDIPYPLNQLLLLFFPSNFNIFYNTFIILTVQRETHFRSDGGLFVPLGRYHTHPYAPLSSQTSIYQ